MKICCTCIVQWIISCGNSGQVEKQPSAGVRALSLSRRVWSLLKACSSKSLFTVVQVVSNILFVHVSAAWTFSHTLSLLFLSSYLTSWWQATCSYSYSPPSGGFLILWFCDCRVQSGAWLQGVHLSQWDAGFDWRCHFSGLKQRSGGVIETCLLLYPKKLNPFHWP